MTSVFPWVVGKKLAFFAARSSFGRRLFAIDVQTANALSTGSKNYCESAPALASGRGIWRLAVNAGSFHVRIRERECRLKRRPLGRAAVQSGCHGAWNLHQMPDGRFYTLATARLRESRR
jgi:hypothetical protein